MQSDPDVIQFLLMGIVSLTSAKPHDKVSNQRNRFVRIQATAHDAPDINLTWVMSFVVLSVYDINIGSVRGDEIESQVMFDTHNNGDLYRNSLPLGVNHLQSETYHAGHDMKEWV